MVSFNIGDGRVLLINTLVGRYDIIEQDLIRLLHASDRVQSEREHKAVSHFREMGYLYESKELEEAAFAKRVKDEERRILQDEGVSFDIIVNFLCNFNCPYCSESEEIRAVNHPMKGAVLQSMFSEMDRLVAKHPPAGRLFPITMMGGEPVLPASRGAIEEIFVEAKKRGWTLQFLTNGFYLSEFAELFAANHEQVHNIQVTIDGTKEYHDRKRISKSVSSTGTFDKIVAGVDRALELGLNIVLRTNVDSSNIECLPAFRDYILEKGWNKYPNFSASPAAVENHSGTCSGLETLVGNIELLKVLLPLSKMGDPERGVFSLPPVVVLDSLSFYFEPGSEIRPRIAYCPTDMNRRFTFAPDGYVYQCNISAGDKKFAIGQFHPKQQYFFARSALSEGKLRTVLNSPKCSTCEIATLCGGNCSLAAYTQFGSIFRPVCERNHESIDTYLAYFRPVLKGMESTL